MVSKKKNKRQSKGGSTTLKFEEGRIEGYFYYDNGEITDSQIEVGAVGN